MEFHHISILLPEVMDGLSIRPDGIYLDGTLGGGGHSSAICERLSEKGRLIGIDQDEAAIQAASTRLKAYAPRPIIVRDNYVNFDRVLDDLGIPLVDGILLDLGVSSYQFDNGERGFSYRTDAPLDMRMDQRRDLTAATIVNTYSRRDLIRILRDYGEERFAPNIAANIEKARAKKPIETTAELAELVKNSIPAKFRTGGHPAKQTFQAIRIEVNGELNVLEDSLRRMISRLTPGGRICIITFHSLEDRVVKNIFREQENPCTCPPEFPVCICGKKSAGRIITRKPILPSEEEQERNSRAKSAKLRIFEKTLNEN